MTIDRLSRSAAMSRPVPSEPVAISILPDPAPTGEALEFVRFCYRRRRAAWPQLYDEMCAVAARGAYRGMSYEELEELGIRFTLTDMPRLAALAQRVAAEERFPGAPIAALRIVDETPVGMSVPRMAPAPG